MSSGMDNEVTVLWWPSDSLAVLLFRLFRQLGERGGKLSGRIGLQPHHNHERVSEFPRFLDDQFQLNERAKEGRVRGMRVYRVQFENTPIVDSRDCITKFARECHGI